MVQQLARPKDGADCKMTNFNTAVMHALTQLHLRLCKQLCIPACVQELTPCEQSVYLSSEFGRFIYNGT